MWPWKGLRLWKGFSVGDADPEKIQFDGQPADRLIENQNPPYNGTLIQRIGQNGKPRVFLASQGGNGDETVLVYSYTSTRPVNGGTYVVLQFKKSGLYVASKGKGWRAQLVLQPVQKFGKDAKEITSTADRRVFLMKQENELEFASCVASRQRQGNSSKARVITLFRDINKPAVFRLEGKGPSLESQWFKMEGAPQGGAGELSDKCQVQEDQHHN